MYRKKQKLSAALAAALCLSLAVPGGSAQAKSLEQQRQNAQQQIKDIKADINSVKNKLTELKNSKSNLQSYISSLDAQSSQLDAQLKELDASIEEKNAEIDQTQQELEEAQDTVDTQYEAMKKRIQYMYENGDYSYVTMLLEASSMTELLNRAEFATQMVDYDRKMLISFQEARQKVEDTKAQLEEEEKELEDMQNEVNEQKDALDLLIDAKTSEISQYQQKIANAEAEADDYADQLAEQEALLEKIENQIAAEAAKKAAELEKAGTVVSSSGFIWPCPSSHRITSTFGPRSQPTAGASTYHKGIDIGASSGSLFAIEAERLAFCLVIITVVSQTSGISHVETITQVLRKEQP